MIGGNRPDLRPSEPVNMIGQNLAANLELATACGKRIILRILAKVLQIDVAMIVARLARDMVDALFLEFPQGDPSHLRHSFHLELPEIVLGDRDKRLKGFRSEEHTSELQSLMRISYAVFCFKNKKQQHSYITA